jgi:hypothetical protein
LGPALVFLQCQPVLSATITFEKSEDPDFHLRIGCHLLKVDKYGQKWKYLGR